MSNGDWSKAAQQSIISSSLNATINGGSFKGNLNNALLANIGSQINAEGAKQIGDNGEVLGVVGKSVNHAVAADVGGVIMQSTLFEPVNLNEKKRQLLRLQEALNGTSMRSLMYAAMKNTNCSVKSWMVHPLEQKTRSRGFFTCHFTNGLSLGVLNFARYCGWKMHMRSTVRYSPLTKNSSISSPSTSKPSLL